MPKIETYTGSGGIAQMRQASASDFADTRGLEKVAKSFEESKLKLEKYKQDQAKLEMARVMAEGRQSWLLELDKRQQAVDNGELDYQGFTDNFNKDYSSWADDLAKNFSYPDMAEELRVNLIEMQTPLMGSAMTYEASKRAYKVKENYNATINPIVEQIYSANSPDGVKEAYAASKTIISALPEELEKQALDDIGKVSLRRMIALSETKADVDKSTEFSLDGMQLADPSDVANLLGVAENQKELLEKKAIADIDQNLKNALESAKNGDLQPGWAQQHITPLLGEVNPDSKEYSEVLEKVRWIDQTNNISLSVSEMTPAAYSAEINALQNKIETAKNPNEANVFRSQLDLLQGAYANRNKRLTDDFSTTAIDKNEFIANLYDMYGKALEDNNANLAAAYFSKYVTAIDAYAQKIGWNGNINYIPPSQIKQMSSDIEDALRKENGLVAVSDKIDSLQALYGNKFPNVLRQLSKENKKLGALYVVAKNKPTSVKADIIAALNYEMVDPQRYQKITTDELVSLNASEILDYNSAFSVNGMIDEEQYRREAYDILSKMYYLQTNNAADSREKALNAVYGDIGVLDKIVYPKEREDSISTLVYAAKLSAQKEKNIALPLGAEGIAAANIKENVNDYIDWITAPDGNGVMAVWLDAAGSSREPVKRNDGSILIYQWDKLDMMDIFN